MTAAVLAGLTVGAGLALIASGWSPAHQPLAVVLARLGQQRVEVRSVDATTFDARVGARVRRLSIIERRLDAMRADLRVLRRSPDEQAAQLVTYALIGLLWGPLVSAGILLVGVPLPLVVPAWLAVGGAAFGALIPLRAVRQQATDARRTFIHALGAYCDVTGMCLAAGQGVDGALTRAANAGTGWPFAELRGALRTGYLRGEAPWEAISRLGTDLAIDDLVELGATIALAGEEGAAVRETVSSKARSMRERLVADAERDAGATTERMGIPATMLLFGFVFFLGYPAIAVLFGNAH
ncbi:MAG: tight adherence protein [Acidimicrobiaceae bacterium]